MLFLKNNPWMLGFITIGLAFIHVALPFFIICAVAFYFCIKSIVLLRSLGKVGRKATGTVVAYDHSNTSHVVPVILFNTTEGQEVKKQPTIFSSASMGLNWAKQNLPREITVNVLYHPDNPKLFVVESNKILDYIVSLIFAVITLAGTIISVYSLLGYKTIFG